MWGGVFQVPQWVPEAMGGTKYYIVGYFLKHPYIYEKVFMNLADERLTIITIK